MLTIFQFFATKTDASKLRMLNGSPAERLLKPITDSVEAQGGRLHIRWGCRCFFPCASTLCSVDRNRPCQTDHHKQAQLFRHSVFCRLRCWHEKEYPSIWCLELASPSSPAGS